MWHSISSSSSSSHFPTDQRVSVVTTKPQDLWAILQPVLQEEADKLDAEEKALREKINQENREALAARIKEEANVESSVNEAIGRMAQLTIDYKSRWMTIFETCLKEAQRQLTKDQTNQSNLQLAAESSQQLLKLSRQMPELENKNEEQVKQNVIQQERLQLLEENHMLAKKNQRLEEKISAQEVEKQRLEKVNKALTTERENLRSSIAPASKPRGTFLKNIPHPIEGEEYFFSRTFDSYLLSPDGKWVVFAENRKAGRIFLFDVTDNLKYKGPLEFGKKEGSPIVQDHKILTFFVYFISPDSQYFVSSELDADWIWKLSSPNEPCFVLKKPQAIGHEYLHAISSDGQWFVYGGRDEFKVVANQNENPYVIILQGCRENSISPVFLSNNEWIASASKSTVYLTPLKDQNGQDVKELKFDGSHIQTLVSSADGKVLAVKYAYIVNDQQYEATHLYKIDELIEKDDESLYFRFGGKDENIDTNIIALSQDGKWFAYIDERRRNIYIWFGRSREYKCITTIKYDAFDKMPEIIANIAWQQSDNELALVLQGFRRRAYWRVPLLPEEKAIENDSSFDTQLS